MAENKTSFVLYSDSKSIIDLLSNEQAGLLLKTLFAYVNDENPIVDDSIKLVFEMIKLQLKRDLKKWERTKESRSLAGKASAEARRLLKENQQNTTNPTNVDFVQQTSTNPTVSVSVNDSVNVNVTTNKNNHEFFKNECLQSQQFLEAVAMKEKIPLDKMQFALTDFNVHLVTTGEIKKDLKEYKYHFTSWVRKMKELKQKEVQQKNKDRL
jgi:hypothetical protein